MITRILSTLNELLGHFLTLAGYSIVWFIDMGYRLAGRLESGETEHWD